MRSFAINDLPITVKSVVAPLVACMVILVLAATFYWSYGSIRLGSSTTAVAAKFSNNTLSALATLSEGHADLIRVLAWKQAGVDQKTIDRLKMEAVRVLDEALERFRQLSVEDSIIVYGGLDSIVNEVEMYRNSSQEVIDMVDGDAFFATMLLTDADEKFIKLHRDVKALSDVAIKNSAAFQAEMFSLQKAGLIGVMSVTAIGVLATVLTSWGVARMISLPVLRMSQAMRKLAAHHLETAVPGLDRKDEIGQMAAAVQVFKENMADNDRLTAEREAEHVERRKMAEQLLRERSLFFASASHDLRQPIYAIRLLACAINDLTNSDQEDSRQELVELASELDGAAANLSEFLDQLLDISRLEASNFAPSVSDAPVAQLFSSLVRQFERVADLANVQLLFVSSTLSVRTDPVLCRRVLANILSNAIKFSEGGTVLLGCRRRGHFAELVVCDNGIGIAAEYQSTIFEDFRQLGNNARQRNNGVGLGLGIVQRIATLLDHPLAVRSEVGKGSMFSILVPIGRPSVSS